MINSRKLKESLFLSFAIFAGSSRIASAQCYDFAGAPPLLGEYLGCALQEVFGVFQLIAVAAALILGMILVLKIAMNRENPDFLSELPTRVMYLIILGLLAAGFGGTLLNMTLRFFGFGDVTTWLDIINETLERMDKWVTDPFDPNSP